MLVKLSEAFLHSNATVRQPLNAELALLAVGKISLSNVCFLLLSYIADY